MSVLILAATIDPCADLMVRAIAERGVPAHRVDTAWFPRMVDISATLRGSRWCGVLRSPHGDTHLEDIDAVWYRSPAAFALSEELSAAERQHIRIEGKFGLGGVLLSLPARWVNRPDLAATACYKPVQMAAAARAGLDVADTLISSTAGDVRKFARRHHNEGRQVVTKMFAANSINELGGRRVAYTRVVVPSELDDLAGIESTAHLFQLRVDKAFDARVVAIGSQLFGFAIHPGSEASAVDFRRDYPSLRYDRIGLPATVADGVTALMDTLGLLYASMDFVVDHDGGWVFIGDVNPGGQYGWLEAATGAPLTAALADLLSHQEGCGP